MDWNEDYFVSPSTIFASLSSDWQQHILASSSYLELGMFDDAALALEEIKPEGKIRTEVLSARVVLYLVAQQWDMPAAVANHLVKVEPGNFGWRINLAYATRRCEGVEKAEKILLPARKLHHDNAMIFPAQQPCDSETMLPDPRTRQFQEAIQALKTMRLSRICSVTKH